MAFQITEFKNVIDFQFLWCRHIMTLCHDVTKPDLPISNCRCARKLILFLFPWFFRSLSSKMLLIFHLCDAHHALTSWRHAMMSFHDVTKPDSHISACRLVRKLILFCFHRFLDHWVQKFYLFSISVMPSHHDVMSWRHWTWFTYLSS